MTKGQQKFFLAVANQSGGIFHRTVVDRVYDAGLVFPRAGNITFFIIGCNGHSANGFFLTDKGRSLVEAAQ